MIEIVDPIAALPCVAQQTRSLENLEMARRGRPRVRESCGNVASGHRAAQVNGEQDLATGRMRDRAANRVKRSESGFRIGGQSRSSVVSVISSRWGPIVSHTAMTSGVWWAMSDAFSSRH